MHTTQNKQTTRRRIMSCGTYKSGKGLEGMDYKEAVHIDNSSSNTQLTSTYMYTKTALRKQRKKTSTTKHKTLLYIYRAVYAYSSL